MASPDRLLLVSGALLAALGVALGAFGAHGLKAALSPEALGWWQTAVQYQMWHAIALVGLATVRPARTAPLLIGGGILIFSGTLYAMALTGARWLGAITPVGGSMLILGWLVLAYQGWRVRN